MTAQILPCQSRDIEHSDLEHHNRSDLVPVVVTSRGLKRQPHQPLTEVFSHKRVRGLPTLHQNRSHEGGSSHSSSAP